MTELNTSYALWLVLLATVVGILSLHGLRAARGMAKSPGQYRRRLIEKGPTHPLAILWIQPGGEESIRSWGIALSWLALVYAVFSLATAGIVSALIVMDCAGMDSSVGPVVELLSKVESDLAA
jgi:hypothetical protein